VTAPNREVTLPDFVREHGDRLRAYHRENAAWGLALHVCLEDGNWKMLDEDTARHAEAHGDHDGAALARLVMRLTPSQRKRLERHLYPEPRP
jgi:hypothetical protein